MPPAPPFFMARLLPLARFGVGWRSGAVVGRLRCPCTCPDLGRFFCAVFKFYARQPLPVRETTPPSPPSWGAGRYGRKIQGRRPGRKKRGPLCRVLKTRVGSPEGRNSPLWPSFPPFLGRNGGPRRVGALRGAAPRGRSKPRPPEGYAVPHRSPARDRAGTHVAGLDLRWSQRNHLPTAPPPKVSPRGRACRPHPRASERLPHSSTTSPVENWVTCAPNSSRSRANPLSPVQWPVRIWATPVSRRRRARARTSWSGVS